MPNYVVDLDSLIMQSVLMRYVTTMGEGLARLAAAIERGNAGRHDAIDEAVCLQALAHILAHRLGELEHPVSGAGMVTESMDADADQDQEDPHEPEP